MFPSITLASCINTLFRFIWYGDNPDSWQLTQQENTITESRIEIIIIIIIISKLIRRKYLYKYIQMRQKKKREKKKKEKKKGNCLISKAFKYLVALSRGYPIGFSGFPMFNTRDSGF